MNFGYASPKRTAVMEGLLTALKWLVPPIYVTAWIVNLDNVKSTILFILAVIGGAFKLYHTIVTDRQNRKLKEMDIKDRERDRGLK